MSPVWLLVAGTLLGVARGNPTNQWSQGSCEEVKERSVMECVHLCRSLLVASSDSDLLVDDRLQTLPPVSPLSSSSSSSSSPQTKRSYSMEHFRWGKPVGKKRFSVSSENAVAAEEQEEQEEVQRRDLDQKVASLSGGVQQKKAGTYKMTHFRWSAPPNERYVSLTDGDGRS